MQQNSPDACIAIDEAQADANKEQGIANAQSSAIGNSMHEIQRENANDTPVST